MLTNIRFRIDHAVCLLGALMFWTAPALADEAPAPAPTPAPTTPTATTPNDGGALDKLRERFNAGTERYKAGAFSDAIVIWNKIYEELGREKGYRIAFNLARAYEQLAIAHAGTPQAAADAASANDFFAKYVNETSRRHEAGETLEPLIETQETEAKDHIGQIKLDGDPPVAAKVDSDPLGGTGVWVSSGKHMVTFRPGTPDESKLDVNVDAKQTVTVQAPPIDPSRVTSIPPAQPRFVLREEHPYSPIVVYIGAGITALSFIAPIAFYVHAHSYADDYNLANDGAHKSTAQSDSTNFNTSRSTYEASWMIPAALGPVTIGLAAYYFLGKKEYRVQIGTASGGIQF